MENSITRVVKLTLRPEESDHFIDLFTDHKQQIASFSGCLELNAYRDVQQPGVFFTISRWQTQKALDDYRFSSFFKELWPKTKAMFADKAVAHSLTLV